jgi:hypothetical protein
MSAGELVGDADLADRRLLDGGVLDILRHRFFSTGFLVGCEQSLSG